MTRLLSICLLAALLSSCGLIRAPFRVAGGVAQATKKAVTAPGEAMKKRKQRKEGERRAQEARDSASRDAGPSLDGEAIVLPDDGEPLDPDASIELPADLPDFGPDTYEQLPPTE